MGDSEPKKKEGLPQEYKSQRERRWAYKAQTGTHKPVWMFLSRYVMWRTVFGDRFFSTNQNVNEDENIDEIE